jgi:hypothetical protein
VTVVTDVEDECYSNNNIDQSWLDPETDERNVGAATIEGAVTIQENEFYTSLYRSPLSNSFLSPAYDLASVSTASGSESGMSSPYALSAPDTFSTVGLE